MNSTVRFTLNKTERQVTTDSRRTLLEVLREDLGLTGTKFGCGEGQCRACTVLLDGDPVRSCLTEINEVEGRQVETIEGLAGADLHPVQEAFVEEQAMQCGYCVPGMVLRSVSLLRRIPAPTHGQIVDALNGHLCRCCGYNNIVRAVQRAARAIKEAQ